MGDCQSASRECSSISTSALASRLSIAKARFTTGWLPQANPVHQSWALSAIRSRRKCSTFAASLHYNGTGWQDVEGVNQMALYRRKDAGIWYARFLRGWAEGAGIDRHPKQA